jgi:MHS family proline/betaine transporter-like MFS transporter
LTGSIGIAAPLLLLLARLTRVFRRRRILAAPALDRIAPGSAKWFLWLVPMVSSSHSASVRHGDHLNLGLSPDAFASWGWRVPFILGILIGPTGWYLRQRCDESPSSGPSRREGRARPAEEKDHARPVVLRTSA